MRLHPVVARLDISQKHHQVSAHFLSQRTTQLGATVFCLPRIEEREDGTSHQTFIQGRAWRRPFFERRRLRRQQIKVFADLGRRRGLCEQRQYLRCCHPQGTKGATVADDAVRNGAIAREVGEELFLEQGRQRTVDIRGERLPPEVFEDLRSFERGSEEGREKTEPFFNLRLDLFARSREPRLVVAKRLRGFQPRFHKLVYTNYCALLALY